MSSIEKVKDTIAQIARRPKHVTLSEIDWVMAQLKQHGYNIRGPRKTTHGFLYGVGSSRFGICAHNRGSNHLKPCYVRGFLNAMIEVGLYED